MGTVYRVDCEADQCDTVLQISCRGATHHWLGGGWYYQTVGKAINDDGDLLAVLDVLAMDVGVIGVFSDWPATVTYDANTKKLK